MFSSRRKHYNKCYKRKKKEIVYLSKRKYIISSEDSNDDVNFYNQNNNNNFKVCSSYVISSDSELSFITDESFSFSENFDIFNINEKILKFERF